MAQKSQSFKADAFKLARFFNKLIKKRVGYMVYTPYTAWGQ